MIPYNLAIALCHRQSLAESGWPCGEVELLPSGEPGFVCIRPAIPARRRAPGKPAARQLRSFDERGGMLITALRPLE